jgi:hypothetical protein
MQSSFYKNRGGAGGNVSPFLGATSSEESFVMLNRNEESPPKTLHRES